MSVDPEVVERVAELARLELDPSQRAELGEQLARIIDFVAQLEEVNISGVAPTKHVTAKDNVARYDVPRPCLPRDEALSAAPDTDNGHFVVPKVLPD